jgi:hypothetical protein
MKPIQEYQVAQGRDIGEYAVMYSHASLLSI